IRGGILIGNGLFEILRVLSLYATPSSFDLRIFYPVLHRRCLSGLRIEVSRGRDHIELIPLPGLTVMRSGIGSPIERKFHLRNIVIGSSRYHLRLRPEVV